MRTISLQNFKNVLSREDMRGLFGGLEDGGGAVCEDKCQNNSDCNDAGYCNNGNPKSSCKSHTCKKTTAKSCTCF